MTAFITCVFGSGGVGKSCLTIQFVQGIFLAKYDPTIEDVYRTTIEIDEKQYELEIFDTAGTDEFSSMKDLYIKDSHGFVLVYSITSKATFHDLAAYYDRIINIKDVDTHGRPAIVLVGNKSDLAGERTVSRETGQELARKWNCSFFETSAKDRANVNEVFYDLARQMSRKSQISPSKPGVASKKVESSDATVKFEWDKTPPPPFRRPVKKRDGCCVLL